MNWDALLRIDRRIIFILMAIVIIVPLIVPMNLPVGMQRTTEGVFNTIENMDPQRQALLISTDYTPQTEAENQPMTITLMRHAFARRVPVLLLSLYVEATGQVAQAVDEVVAEFNARATSHADSIIYGRDVIFLGWVPPPIVPILAMGESIKGIYKTDFYGNATADLPLTQRIENYSDIGLVAAITASSSPIWYVQLAQTKWGVKVAAGCTAVSAPEFYPYFRSEQLAGMLGGMKGAAEYEDAVARKYGRTGTMRASQGMGAQSAAHLLIMAFVILGNIGYFVGRRASK